MIDFDAMKSQHLEGIRLVDSLEEIESSVLEHYCSLATEVILMAGKQKGTQVDQLVINSLKNGIALGLRLEVIKGEVCTRQ